MPYMQQFACFDCRKAFKYEVEFRRWHLRHPQIKYPQSAARLVDDVICPDCRQPMWLMGRKFKAPKRSNIKQWHKVEKIRKAGLRRFPKYLWQADQMIARFNETLHPPSEGEKLLAKIKRNAGKD